MSAKNGKVGKFKSKGSNILKAPQAGPGSMNEFLEDKPVKDTQKLKGSSVQLRKTTDPQNHNYSSSLKRYNTHAQKHKDEIAQNSIYAKTQRSPEDYKSVAIKDPEVEAVERIHVQIRKELANKLIEMVYRRKRDGRSAKRKATQRQIIEQALEEYFAKEGI
jgi:hypothetical protein